MSEPLATPPQAAWPFEVRLVPSRRRTKTIGARLVGGVLEVRVPAAASADEQRAWAGRMAERFARRLATDRIDLPRRAARLAGRYDLPRAASVRWVDNQQSRWGSCSADGSIRLSSRLATLPDWVVDFVLVHELAHLVERDHGPAFASLVARYPQAQRAQGFLEGVAFVEAAGHLADPGPGPDPRPADGADHPPEPDRLLPSGG